MIMRNIHIVACSYSLFLLHIAFYNVDIHKILTCLPIGLTSLWMPSILDKTTKNTHANSLLLHLYFHLEEHLTHRECLCSALAELQQFSQGLSEQYTGVPIALHPL
jgi:hypothetical protein